MNNQSRDFKWFKENHEDLFAKYGDVYLAIKDEQVLGVYSTYAEGVKKTAQVQELGTFIVQHCTHDESGYTNYIYSMNH